MVFVCGDVNASDNITGVTYNGTSMTLVDKEIVSGAQSRSTYLFFLLAPTTGANNVVVSASNFTYIASGACSYTGVRQTSQPDVSTKNTASSVTSMTTTLTTAASNCWTVMSGYHSNAVGSAGAGTTLRATEIDGGLLMLDSNGDVTGLTSLIQQSSSSSTKMNSVMCAISPVNPDIPGFEGAFQRRASFIPSATRTYDVKAY
jgi:hypothetical protein